MITAITKYYLTTLFFLFSICTFLPLSLSAQNCAVGNPIVDGFTNGITTSDVAQSFVLSNCPDGTITAITVFSFTNNTGIDLTIYEGEGFAGNVVYSESNLSLQAGAPLSNSFTLNPKVDFTMGSTYTFRLQLTAGGSFQLAKSTVINSYANGQLYENGATQANEDLFFSVTTETTVLPVELVYFKAMPKEEMVQLEWHTATETNNMGFEVQRSTNGSQWNTLNFVDGRGTTRQPSYYEFTDASPHSGTSFYRLKQMDYDGQVEFSDLQVVTRRNGQASFDVFPNPAQAGQSITIQRSDVPLHLIQIYDGSGQQVFSQTPGEEVTSLVLPPTISTGLYFIRTFFSNGQMQTRQLVIQ